MMSIEAVFPAIGGIGIRLIGTTVTFAATAGSSVGAGVAPTGRLACAGTVSTVCVAHCDGLTAAVEAAGGVEADGAAAGVAGALHPVTIAAAAKASARRGELIMSCPPRKSRLVSSLSSSRQYAC